MVRASFWRKSSAVLTHIAYCPSGWSAPPAMQSLVDVGSWFALPRVKVWYGLVEAEAGTSLSWLSVHRDEVIVIVDTIWGMQDSVPSGCGLLRWLHFLASVYVLSMGL
jgi:hypothetical protein